MNNLRENLKQKNRTPKTQKLDERQGKNIRRIQKNKIKAN